jgi:pectate lyase
MNLIANDLWLEKLIQIYSIHNLEWVSVMENNCHKSLNIKNSSKYVGVSFNKRQKKWDSRICISQKQFYLGTFKTEEEAYAKRVEYMVNNNIENKYL